MGTALTQAKARMLVRDYLRETGRRGVTSLMRDIARHTRTAIFAQRTLEKWLTDEDRLLQDENWELVRGFIESEAFRRVLPYASAGPAEKRLVQVADGLCALYGHPKHPDGTVILPSQLQAQGEDAVRLLAGNWENVSNLKDHDVPRSMCKIEPVSGKRYAKFAYIALFRSKQISTTGLIIYLNSDHRADADYCHAFVLQLWRRRDPGSDTKMPGALIYLTAKAHQPQLAISRIINTYFYKEQDPIGASGEILYALEPNLETARHKTGFAFSELVKFRWAAEATQDNALLLRRVKQPIAEEEQIIDALLEDVLPHGLAET